MNRLHLISFLCLCFTYTQAQQLSLFTQYRENLTIINPAAVSSNYLAYGDNLSFGASYRSQWEGFENAPTTATLRGDFLYETGSTFNLIAGGYLINDQTGPTGFTGLYGRAGGVISDDPYYGGIAVGLTFGMVQYRVNTSEIVLRDGGDAVAGDDQNQFFPDVGLGIFAYQQISGGIFDDDYIYGGISVPQVIGLDLTFQSENGEYFTQRVQHFYGVLGMYKFFRDGSFLEPSVWVKYAQNVPVNVDINLRYQIQNSFWIGLGGSTGQSFHAEVGFLMGENLGFDNNFRIGYGYDYSFSSFGPSVGGSHEINISYSLQN